ncbi:unnamed protein product [Thelazia callipaeda]|uniref:Intraflagellar transport protein 46 homolog n=1 Tax=Thelazia callipaeda TaxID=103827 RepID=A0A0N5D1H5_THECL|nr:unnamed protein product [Thelazia callipaeda]
MHKDNENEKSETDNEGLNDSVLRELFFYIEAYTAETIQIEPFLKPFLPDYVPAVGDVDTFIKVPRPDQMEDKLGLTVLDEPAIEQSDPVIMDMQMRNEVKGNTAPVNEVALKKLDRADQNAREIDTVDYPSSMPSIESLMEEWPTEMENLLKTEQLPKASLDTTLEEYVDICLALFNIPVQKSRIKSLHVLFTLFSEFRNSQHFRNLAENVMNNSGSTADKAERLEL